MLIVDHLERFKGLAGRRLGHYTLQAGVATALALAILAVFAELIHLSVGVSFDAALLALGLDPVFVAFHHLLRMVVLMIAAPLWVRWLQRQAP